MENMKKTRGRQRLKMKFIEEDKNRIVTFTKRRNGIYKKASELCILTGIDIAILVTTFSGKFYSFAHPNIESIESQLLHQTRLPEGILESYREDHIKELIQQLEDVCKDIKVEEQRACKLKEMKDGRVKNLWEKYLDELTDDEARNVKEQLREMQARIFAIHNKEYLQQATSTVISNL